MPKTSPRQWMAPSATKVRGFNCDSGWWCGNCLGLTCCAVRCPQTSSQLLFNTFTPLLPAPLLPSPLLPSPLLPYPILPSHILPYPLLPYPLLPSSISLLSSGIVDYNRKRAQKEQEDFRNIMDMLDDSEEEVTYRTHISSPLSLLLYNCFSPLTLLCYSLTLVFSLLVFR